MSSVTIRRETDADISAISTIVTEAFAGLDYSDQSEARIVEKLRDDNSLSVSLVAVTDLQIVGHVAVSPVTFDDGTGGWFGLGPVSVSPDFHGRGIGSLLIEHALDALREGGAGGVVVIGDPSFYSRFGFVRTEFLGYPGDIDDDFLRALRLGDSRFPSGNVHYHPAFS